MSHIHPLSLPQSGFSRHLPAYPEGGQGLGVAGVLVGEGLVSLSCCPSPSQVSPYPVILSLENHCGLEQQAAMARHLHTILGDMLVTRTLDSQNPEELPSPEVRLSGPQPGWGEGLAPRSTIHLCSGPLSSVLTFCCCWFFFLATLCGIWVLSSQTRD